jgi:glycosyltransferase involved in cell wall biosynthesis
MKARIGCFIPKFPGQTHTWIWREHLALAELGIEADLVSTERPPKAIIPHAWADEAQRNTIYFVPLGIKDFLGASTEVLKAGLTAWLHCLTVILRARDTSLSQKFNLLASVFMAGKLVWLAKTKGWSHVHVHSCAGTANIAMFASILSGLTYSLALLAPLEEFGPNQEQKWKYASFAIVVSEKLRNVVKDKLANFLPKQVAVATMGVNLAETKRHSPYIQWEADRPCRIYTCGRLDPIKGHKYLIETVELLRQRGFDVRLQIAGEDEQGGSGYRRDLERIIQEKSLSEYIELLGSVSEERNRQGIEEAHIFALASLSEGISVAVMEAMAMEMPVIVTDVGGNSELVDDGVDAILVQPEKPEEMADVIMKVLQDKELALSLSHKSRKKIAARFHHRISAEAIARCLEELARVAKKS